MKNKKIWYLLKRDIYLLLQQWKKIMLYLISILVIDIILLLYQRNYMFKSEIIGISVEAFLDNPNKLPIQWIWTHFGSILLFLDIGKKDIYKFSSCVLPHLGKKSYFWYSKILLGGILAFGTSLLVFIEKVILIFLADNLNQDIKIQSIVLIKACLLQFLGIYTLYCIYSFISLLKNEITGLLVCISYIIIGLSTNNEYLYCNIFMQERGSIYRGIIIWGLSFVIVYLIGGKLLCKKDIF